MDGRSITNDVITQIRDRADIVETIAAYLRLDKAGQNFKGLCPFHSEKTPSFIVSPARQAFHCFGCGVGGDVFTFVMKIEGVTFASALQQMADRVGVRLPAASKRWAGKEVEERDGALYRVNQAVARFFHDALLHEAIGHRGRAYLHSRGITDETIHSFQLGYAPASWDALLKAMRADGWSDQHLVDAGVVIRRDRDQEARLSARGTPTDHERRPVQCTQADDGQAQADRQHCYDRFRDRVMFPIFDVRNRVVGFGGRALDGAEPKYLNSPETPLFKKGVHLYALEKAKIDAARERHLIIVEGYFDAVSLHQSGIRNVVATMGTALTPSHLPLIQRFTTNVKLIFDPDPAGVRAALRAAGVQMLELFAGRGMSVDVVALPDQSDPDTVVRQGGKEAFEQHVAQAEPLIRFAIRQHLRQAEDQSIEAQLKSLDAVLRIVLQAPDSLQTMYLKQVAEQLGLDERTLRTRYLGTSGKQRRPAGRQDERTSLPPPPKGEKAEELLVQLLLHEKVLREWLGDLRADEFKDPRLREIFSFAVTSMTRGGPVDSGSEHGESERGNREVRIEDSQFAIPNSETQALASRLMLSTLPLDEVNIERAARECVAKIKSRNLNEELTERTRQVRLAEMEGRASGDMHAQLETLRQIKSAHAVPKV